MSEARLLELLAGRALCDLSADEPRELERLVAGAPHAESVGLELELAAARVDLAHGPARFEPIPAGLFARLQARGEAEVARRRIAPSTRRTTVAGPGAAPDPDRGAHRPASPAAGGPRTILPWLVAAAALLVAFLGWIRPDRVVPTTTPAGARSTLVATADDLVELPWSAAGELAESGVSGDVVWSDARQEGYMRFAGLPRNDPTAEQYQLWIFDEQQSLDTPVDGGVFDSDANGELVVPIDAKLGVHEAIAFAVTVEKPGGVVASDRSRLVLTAGL